MQFAIWLAIGLGVLGLLVFIFVLSRLQKKDSAEEGGGEGGGIGAGERPDPREERIEESAQALRHILLHLADVIRNTDHAANSSTSTLREIRRSVSHSDLPPSLAEAQALLLQEIDRMLTSHNELKQELAKAQEDLAEQRKQIEALRTAVRIDALTRVGNRAAFDERLQEAIDRLRRYQQTFSLAMIDIDHFKKINDTYGHQAGDRILKGLATKIKASLRASDVVCRYGGEEFGAILLKADLTTARQVAEKLRDSVGSSNFTLDHTTIRITISIGVAEARPEETAESLIQRADRALYKAKERGRDRVEVDEAV